MGFYSSSREDIWQKLSNEIHADYIKGGFWNGGKVQAHVDNWIVVLDTFTESKGRVPFTYTRIRAPFINIDKLYFRIYREELMSDLGKLFGMQDICVGYKKVDDNFIIKGNNEDKVKSLFSNEKVRELFEKYEDLNLEIKDDEGMFHVHFPEGVDELYLTVPGIINDINSLKELYEFFGEILKELSDMGSSSKEDPKVIL